MLVLDPNYISAISVRIQPGNIKRVIDFIQQKWENSFLGELFEFSFLDNRMNQLYENEMKMQNIFFIFSCFSIFVACLGLFGLAAFTASERTKEIGIRKVLGASTGRVIFLMSKEFVKWIVFANVAAWPLAWFIMSKWLQNFAYQTDIGWFVFLLAGVMTLVIAVFTFSFQAVKAAMANPVDSLRYE